MKYLKILTCICLQVILYSSLLNAQPKCYIEHYGAEDGLPQHTVMDILQDQKGFMWFSTWDGLCKFDGYKFTAYKIAHTNLYHMRSSRIDHMVEDKDGYIWTLSYDKEVHRFDPRTEQFTGLRSLNGYEDFSFTGTRIQVMPSGKVWLRSANEGCISIINSDFKVELYNTDNGKSNSNIIHNIYEDKDKNSWILTDDGLKAYTYDGELYTQLMSERVGESLSFYSANETETEIWFGGNAGKIRIYNKQDKSFRFIDIDDVASIVELKAIDANKILISTNTTRFYIYNTDSKQLQPHDLATGLTNKKESIQQSYIDKHQHIWFELAELGVSMFDLKTAGISHFRIDAESPIVRVTAPPFFVLENNNEIWVHPKGGGFSLYDSKTNKLIPFYNAPNSPDWKFSSMLHAGQFDKQGNLWLSTHSNGLEKIVFNNDMFKPTLVDANLHSSMNNLTRCLFEDRKQNLWVATRDGKIQVYDSASNKLGYLCNDGTIGHGTPMPGLTYCMMQDAENNIWIGTKGKGIYKLKEKAHARSYSVTHYENNPADKYSLNSDNVYNIYQDAEKRVWIGTYGGGLNMMTEKEEGRFFNSNNLLKNYPSKFGSQIRIIAEDNNGNLCVGTTLGLIMFPKNFESVQDIDFKYFIREVGDPTSLSANDVHDIITTRKGDTYIATFGGGLNRIEAVDKDGYPTAFKTFTTKSGLSSSITLLVAEDHEGKLWVSSEGNVSKFDPETEEVKTYSEIYRLIKGNAFSEGAKCISSTGIIYFGYSKGFIAINPKIVEDNKFKPYVALTNFQIGNKDVELGEYSPLAINIDDLKELRLNNKQNFFNIEFAAIDYVEARQILYAYKLDGFDTEWIVTQDQRVATYNNLSPGEYTFHVRSTNSDGIWMDNAHVLPIKIVPSFWQTKWAIVLYLVLFLSILAVVLRSLFIYYRLRDKMTLEQDQIEMRTRFFMDISHEIRTPLTMVVSPIENILEGNYSKEDVKSQLQLVLKNANRMLRMVNQILDFRKIQKRKLNIEKTLIGKHVEGICRNFSRTAEIQGVNFNINNSAEYDAVWVDRDNVEKLVFNLLSNAFKYTQAGNIDVNIYKKNNAIAVEVADQGKGMTKDILGKLFTRFASFSTDKNKPSTGIGLSIVKEIADKHKAKIEVESEENKGTKFTILFPMGYEHFDINDIELVAGDNLDVDTETPTINIPDNNIELINTGVEAVDEKNTILIVEDDTDLRGYIRMVLEGDYNILEAENGKEGYEIAIDKIPDFILSDIMMPEVDGVEFLQNIRRNDVTSHIPFILLTAKVNLESRLEGLEYGADDYITKPFSVKFLKARIENIMLQRKRLYESYNTDTKVVKVQSTIEEETQQPIITAQDEAYIKRVKEVIIMNVDNSEFLVEDLVSELAMSRTVFFKKLKSLTGLAPIEFIREVKIQYAAKMITSTDYTIKEISFMIGIADAKYFTRWFKSIMGVTPTEYRNKQK